MIMLKNYKMVNKGYLFIIIPRLMLYVNLTMPFHRRFQCSSLFLKQKGESRPFYIPDVTLISNLQPNRYFQSILKQNATEFLRFSRNN